MKWYKAYSCLERGGRVRRAGWSALWRYMYRVDTRLFEHFYIVGVSGVKKEWVTPEEALENDWEIVADGHLKKTADDDMM